MMFDAIGMVQRGNWVARVYNDNNKPCVKITRMSNEYPVDIVTTGDFARAMRAGVPTDVVKAIKALVSKKFPIKLFH